jgi:hypothetical protein
MAREQRRFWKITAEKYSGGYDGGEYMWMAIYWGTWFEAARECVKEDESIGRHKFYRSVEPFELPDVSRKRKAFYVL